MKRVKYLLLITTILMTNAIDSFAYIFSAQNDEGVTIYYDFSYINLPTQALVTSPPAGTKYKGNIKIPSKVIYQKSETEIHELHVQEIGKEAFQSCTELTAVELPNTILKLQESAFIGCTSLTDIELPTSLMEIGNNAFYNCSNLKDVIFNEGLTTISGNAFQSCTNLKSIVLPNSLSSIGSYAFSYCTNLESIVLPNSLSSIGSRAFQYCNSLKTIDVPNSVTKIGDMAFSFCDNLTAVRFPQNSQFTSIPYCCCYYNRKETQKNPSLEAVILPSNVTSIDKYAFAGCTSLKCIFCESNSLNSLDHSFDDVPSTCTLIVPQNFSTDIKFPKAYGTGIILDKNTTEVNLSDNTYFYNFLNEEAEIAKSTYTRTFQAGNFYLPLFLPFNIGVSDIKSSLGSTCKISQLKGINYYDGTIVLSWLPVESGQLNANTPYIVKLESQASQIEATNVTFAKDRITVNGYFEDNGCTLTLTGVYLPEQLEKGDGKYVLTKNNSFQQAGANLTLNPYRFYLTFTTPTGQAKIKMNVDGEENQDALESIFYTEGEGDNIYYDLNGRRVENPSNGIFITNGKKVLF